MSTKFYNLKQEISNSPQIDEAVSEKAIKEYVDKTGLQLINPTTTAGSSSSPYLAVKWDVSDVAGVTTVSDGMRVLARVNAVGVSTGGLLLSIDGGTTYHPVVYAASTIPTTTYMAVGTTVLLIYNADATATCYGTSGTSTSYTGCWQLDYHFTLYMYRLLHNNGTYVTKTDLKRYKLMVQYDETTMLPISSGSSTSGHTYDTTNAFMPFGQICYCNTSTTNYKSAGAAIGASVLANMYAFDLRYTFNGGTSMLTANKDVYLVANPQSDGKAKIDSSPLTQTLPSTEDNKIYIYLGHTYSAYQMELHPVHPIYWYKNGAIRLWDNPNPSDAVVEASFFIDNSYDVTSSSHTPTQLLALVAAHKDVVVSIDYLGDIYKSSNIYYNNDSGDEWVEITAADQNEIYILSGDPSDDSWTCEHQRLKYEQSFIPDPTSSNQTSETFIDTIVQYSDGQIYATKKKARNDKVAQIINTEYNASLNVLLTTQNRDSDERVADFANYSPGLTFNPYSNTLSATYFSGNGAGLTHVPVDSHTHGNIANDGKITSTTQPNDVTIANGDKLVVVDATDTKVARTSVAFDGSTTSKYLSQKGTWENVPTNTDTKLYIKNGALADWTATEGGTSVSKMLSLAAIDDGSTFGTSGADGAYTGLRVPIVAGTLSTSSLDVLVFGQIAPMTGKSTLATGDMLVIANAEHGGEMMYSSALAIDTTNTTQYLRKDGTWATPAGSGDTGYTSSSLSNNTSTITFGNTKEYKRVVVTGSTQTFNLSVGNNCTNYLLVTNSGSGDCVIALGVQSGTNITSVVKPSSGITIPTGKAIELSFIKIADAVTLGEYTLVVTVSAEMEIDTLS